ncbi:MAG: hypothetical protein ACFNLO_02930 [Selenomonas massiliensis]
MSSIEAFRRNLRLAVEASAVEVATTAKMEHRYKQQSSDLLKAVLIKPKDRPSMEKTVYLDGNRAPYGVFIHEGIKPHDIFPKRRKALRWVDGNKFLFAKRVRFPGWDPDPFIYDAFESNQDTIMNIFDRYTERALREVEDAITSRRITG